MREDEGEGGKGEERGGNRLTCSGCYLGAKLRLATDAVLGWSSLGKGLEVGVPHQTYRSL